MENQDTVFIKGHSWILAKKWIEKHCGREGIEKMKAAVSPEIHRVFFEKEVLAISRVDYTQFVRVLETADKLLGTGDLSMINQLSANAAEIQFKGLFSVFFRIVSVEYMFNNFIKAWKQQYGRGVLTIEWMNKKHVWLKVEDFPAPKNHEYIEFAYHHKMFSLCGAKNMTINHPKCHGRGDGFCVYEYIWE